MSDKIFLWTADWIKKHKLPLFQSRMVTASNDQAKKHAFKNFPSPSVFLALKQSQGRGGGGRKWEDSDLMLSVLWEKNLKKVKSPEGFTLDGLKALKTAFPALNVKFKAQNDLLLDEKKLAGILIEFLSRGEQTALIVGLGLNVFSRPKGLSTSSACLADHTKNIHPENWGVFLQNLLHRWSKRASSRLNKF